MFNEDLRSMFSRREKKAQHIRDHKPFPTGENRKYATVLHSPAFCTDPAVIVYCILRPTTRSHFLVIDAVTMTRTLPDTVLLL